MENELVAE